LCTDDTYDQIRNMKKESVTTIETKHFMGGSFQIRRIDAKTNDYARLHPWYPNESPWSPVRRALRKWSSGGPMQRRIRRRQISIDIRWPRIPEPE